MISLLLMNWYVYYIGDLTLPEHELEYRLISETVKAKLHIAGKTLTATE